jgi:hypothetical protein
MPELLFEAIAELQSAPGADLFLKHTPKQLRRLADCVAAPALYDDMVVPLRWINTPARTTAEAPRQGRTGSVEMPPATNWKASMAYSREICSVQRVRRIHSREASTSRRAI